MLHGFQEYLPKVQQRSQGHHVALIGHVSLQLCNSFLEIKISPSVWRKEAHETWEVTKLRKLKLERITRDLLKVRNRKLQLTQDVLTS